MNDTGEFQEKSLNLKNPYALKRLNAFLSPLGFAYDARAVDYTMILCDAHGEIAGTGSFQGQVLKYVAVAPEHRATDALPVIVTHLINLLMRGHDQIFAFTRPASAGSFVRLGFKEIATAEPLYTLLEFGYRSIRDYQNYLVSRKAVPVRPPVSAIVVNCNPFSNGHQYLIETAASQSRTVYLFVVEEDRSAFPFQDRWDLIEEGTRHLQNVVMLKGSHYVVSGATFPNYFVREEEPDLVTRNQAELDVVIFARHIVPVLGITRRYVGTEPYSTTTRSYNEAMKRILGECGVEVVEVERLAAGAGAEGGPNYISATKIRQAIRDGDLDRVAAFLPPCTHAYLQSARSDAVRAKLRG